jgi:hypothetical protein
MAITSNHLLFTKDTPKARQKKDSDMPLNKETTYIAFLAGNRICRLFQ